VLIAPEPPPVLPRLSRLAGAFLLVFAVALSVWLVTELTFNHEILLGERRTGGYIDGEENYQDTVLRQLWLGVILACTVPVGVALTVARRPRLAILMPGTFVCGLFLITECYGTVVVLHDWDPHGTLRWLTVVLSVLQLACLTGALALMAKVMSHPAVHRGRL
jgi:hypothetical protein